MCSLELMVMMPMLLDIGRQMCLVVVRKREARVEGQAREKFILNRTSAKVTPLPRGPRIWGQSSRIGRAGGDGTWSVACSTGDSRVYLIPARSPA